MYTVENRLDLGGTCFARYHGQFPIFASKTDQIMSRYRPIAPKPSVVTPTPGGSNSTVDSQSCSSPRISIRKGSAESGRASRIRKRISDSNSAPPRGQKRARGPNNPIDLPSEPRSEKCLISSVTVLDGSFRYPLDCRTNLMDRSGNLLEKDSAFMERAAASASPGVLSERKMDILSQQKSLGVGGRGLSGMMDRIGVVSSSAKDIDVVAIQALLNNSDMQSVSGSGFYGNCEGMMLPIVPSSNDLEQEISPREEKEAGGKNLVTLPLLPETPSCKDSMLGSSVSDFRPLNADTYQEGNFMHSSSNDEVQLRLFTKETSQKEAEPGEASGQINRDTSTVVPAIDLSYLEQMYSTSLDPVILLLDNESQDVLWFNPAYERMIEAAEERSNVDDHRPLIINATPLASFIFKSEFQVMENSKATLWGFMKKFPGPEIATVSDQGFADNRDHLIPPDSSASGVHHPQQKQRSPDDAMSGISPSGQSISLLKKGVIMPQPVRPVGSLVSIEYIEDASLQNSPLRRSTEEIEEQLESEMLPAIISDAKNRVRFANSAYKKMVGQPECSWLESTVCHSNKLDGFSNSLSSSASYRISGEVILNCQLPLSASALSCWVKIQWSNNNGEKSSIRASCDVVRFIICNPKDHVYVWKFHVAAAFGLNCGV